jgi:hypothetical protein
MSKKEIILRDPADLTLHPLLKTQPALDKESAEFISMLEDIRERGFDYPILIDEQNRIVDGRHRWLIAKQIQLKEIPCEVRHSKEAAEIIVCSIWNRRHYATKGARAYLVAPLFASVIASGNERRLANLKKGAEAPRKPIESASVQTVGDLAQKLGCSRDLFEQAVKLRKAFDKAPELQAQFEEKILSGELGLGACLAGIAGKESTQGKSKGKEDQLDLFAEVFGTLEKRFKYWSKFNPDDKGEALKAIRRAVANMPADLRSEFKRAISACEKEEKANG